jgi:hypothetical protein
MPRSRSRKSTSPLPQITEAPAAPAVARPGSAKPIPELQGLTLKVAGRELAVRLGERVRWHRQRADVLIEGLTKLGEVERATRDDLDPVLGRLESPRGSMEKALREHQARATYLAFVRDHLTADAVYRLDAADLRMIDLVPLPRC